MKKDLILKDITKEAIRDILKYILKIEIDDFEFLDIEFAKIESRKADILIKAKNKILHIEFQSTNDYNMPFRMLRYWTEIKRRYKKENIFQYVIYIGNKTLKMKNELKYHNIDYKYDIIDVKTLDCKTFMDINTPEALVIAVLCDFNDENPNKIIKEILSRLLEITKDIDEFKRYLLMLEELSTSRDLKEIIKEEEMGLMHLTWEDLPSYEIGLEDGVKKGLEQGKNSMLKISIKAMNELGIDEKTISQKLQIPLKKVKEILNDKN